MSSKIFINYRRQDDPGFTHALYFWLEGEFGADNVFMDVEEGHIRPGDDFIQVLNQQVAACDVLLAIIGPRWLDLLAAHASDSKDWVAMEIKTALEMGKRVIPVLVGGATMLRPETLPETISPITNRNAVGLRPERFKADCHGLISSLKEQLAAAEREHARTEAERKAAEAARQQREAEEAARVAAVEARRDEHKAAGLSAEQIRKAEELANWEFVKDRTDIHDLRDHLARFPLGTTERYALAKLDALIWAGLGPSPTLEQLQAYVGEFPKGTAREAARALIATLERDAAEARAAEERRIRETDAWSALAVSTDTTAIEEFLNTWPNGQHADAARARLEGLSGRNFIGHADWVMSVALAPDGRMALSGSRDKTIKLWDVATRRELRTFTGHKLGVLSVAFAPDGRTALSGSDDATLRLWDVTTGKELRTFTGHRRPVFSVAFAPDGRTALSGSEDKTLKLWDVASGKELRSFSGHRYAVFSVAFAPDGHTALSGSEDKTLKLWDVATGSELQTLAGHRHAVFSVAFARDGHTVLSGSEDRTLRFWDVATGSELCMLTGHRLAVLFVAFAPDGHTALSGSDDATLKLWDLESARGLRTFRGHADRVRSAAFAPDGRTVLSASCDRTLKLWDVL